MLVLLIVVSGIAACSKKKESNVTVISKESLAGSYKLTAATTSGQNIYDVYLEACQKDDIYRLNADFTAAIMDGVMKCNPPGDETGTWNLVGNSKIVILGQEADIVSYDGKTLVVSFMNNSSGFNLLVTATFTKQ